MEEKERVSPIATQWRQDKLSNGVEIAGVIDRRIGTFYEGNYPFVAATNKGVYEFTEYGLASPFGPACANLVPQHGVHQKKFPANAIRIRKIGSDDQHGIIYVGDYGVEASNIDIIPWQDIIKYEWSDPRGNWNRFDGV